MRHLHEHFHDEQHEHRGRRRGHGSPPQRRRDHRGHGRKRARRGSVGRAVLTLLAESPKHGYELITALEERSGGRWKPSPGAIYPALHRLEHRGLITSEELDGKRRYSLTDEGRELAAKLADEGEDAPWDDEGPTRGGELRRALAELTGPTRQIGRFGSPDQVAKAAAVLRSATGSLYQILADGPSDDAVADDDQGADTTGESAD